MGGSASKEECRVLMLGLNGSGKTTILYQLTEGLVIKTSPTEGFNVESLETNKKHKLTLWDIGGEKSLRPFWRHFYTGTKAIIFVLDSTDRARIDEADIGGEKSLRPFWRHFYTGTKAIIFVL